MIQPEPSPNWLELFPDRDFQFTLGLKPGDPRSFFEPGPNHATWKHQRRQELRDRPDQCILYRSDAAGMVKETLELAEAWTPFTRDDQQHLDASSEVPSRLAVLGILWEPDYLLLAPDADGNFILKAGVICFPSSWSPENKLGLNVHHIHAPVPTLNSKLGTRIDSFLLRMRPATGWLRANWGISASATLNQHPSRQLSPVSVQLSAGDIWIRIEHQFFYKLPNSGGILFGIRLQNLSVLEITMSPEASRGLVRALVTMPDEIARYKNILPVREHLIQLLAPP